MKKYLLISSFFVCFLSVWSTTDLISQHAIPEIVSNVEGNESEGLLEPPVCNVPTWPSTSNITQTSATFNWSWASGAINYTVQTRLPNGTWYDVPGGPFSGSSITVGGFNPNTTYEWRVRSNCSAGQISNWTNPISFTTAGGSACESSSWLETTNIGHTTATFNWSPVSGAVSYSIQWRLPGGSWNYLSGGPWQTTWLNIGGFQPGTTYEWRVRSNCHYGVTSPWSNAESFTTLYACYTPTWPSTSNITQSTATFSWSPVSGAHSYTVQTRLPNGNWVDAPGGPFYSTSVTVGGFSPNTTYQWRVRANCGNGQYSYWTSPIYFTTSGVVCHAPQWLSTTNVTHSTATFNWEHVSGAINYSIQYRVAGGTWYDLSGGPYSGTWINVGGFQPGTSYEWRIRSNCHNWVYSDWSYPTGFTTLYTCDVPTWPTTSHITDSTATFNWSPVYGAHSYSIQTRLPNGVWYDVPGGPFTNTSVTVNGFNPNTTYEWRVRANCGNGQFSHWTHGIYFTTTGELPCTPPTWLSTINITHTTATFSWSPVPGAVSYSIQWRPAGGNWQDLSGGPWSGTWLNVGGFQPGTAYEWRVRSNCHNWVTSDWSNPSGFVTLFSCNVPSWPSTSNITETTATFNWMAVSGAESYSLQTRLPNGAWTDVPGGPFTNTSVTVGGFQPGTTYQWRVRANCGHGQYSYWTYGVYFTTPGGACHAPVWLATINITHTTATFSWCAVSGAQNYSVQWRHPGGNWHDLAGGPFSGTWLNVGGFAPGTTYEWRVRSNCYNWVISDWSYPETFTTLGACYTPSWPATYGITQTTATFSWMPVSGAQSYTLQTRSPYGVWYDVPGGPFYTTDVTVDGFSPGTTYEWRVRANCGNGQYSYWTTPITFTTAGGSGPDNDYCSNATWLWVEDNCQYTAGTNMNATPSTPAPVGGCSSYNYKDVWYKFTMPNVSNPVVTIHTSAGTLTDAVMELYVGTTCSNKSFIACENDNNNGNGSDMPVISLSGGPGSTIWVRVWGYDGSMGTFNICVFDHHSWNLADAVDVIELPDAGVALESIVDESTDVEDVKVDSEMKITTEMKVMPNPANEFFNITYLQTATSKVTDVVVSDLSGKRILSETYDRHDSDEFTDQINVSDIVPGIYIVQLVTTSGILTEKIIIAR